MSAVVDTAHSPIRFTVVNTVANTSATSAAFVPANDSFLVVTIQMDSSGAETFTVQVSGGGLTWTKKVEIQGNTSPQGGYTSIWTAPIVTGASLSVTVNRVESTASTGRISIVVYTVDGADINGTPVDTIGANNSGVSTTNNLTTANLTPNGNGLLIVADTEWNAGGLETSSDLTINVADYAGAIDVLSGWKPVTSGVATNANIDAGGTSVSQHRYCQIIILEAPASPLSLLQHHVFDQLSAGTTVSVTVSPTSVGSLLVVGVVLGGTSGLGVSGVSDNATGGTNNYSQALGAQANFNSGGGLSDIWYCLSAARGGATTITAALRGTGLFYAGIFIWEVSGFTNAAPDAIGNVSNGVGVGTDLNGPAVVTTSTIGFIAAVANPGSSITATPKSGNEFVSGGDIGANGSTASCSLLSITAASHQPVWTDSASGDSFSASAAAFKQAAILITGINNKPNFSRFPKPQLRRP